MSWPAVTWALTQTAPNSASKFLLTVIADAASVGDWIAYPSVAYLSDTTQQDRKTVLVNLKRLEEAGLITAVGKTGKTGQVTKWRLPVGSVETLKGPKTGTLSDEQNSPKSGTVQQYANDPKTGTVSERQTVPNFRANSTNFPRKQYQKRDTEPVRNQVGTKEEAAHKRAARFDAAAIELPEWLQRDAWREWVADRVERRKPITHRAAEAQLRKLDEYRAAGHDPAAVIRHSIACGYQGLYPPKGGPAAGGAFGSISRGAPSAQALLHADDNLAELGQ